LSIKFKSSFAFKDFEKKEIISSVKKSYFKRIDDDKQFELEKKEQRFYLKGKYEEKQVFLMHLFNGNITLFKATDIEDIFYGDSFIVNPSSIDLIWMCDRLDIKNIPRFTILPWVFDVSTLSNFRRDDYLWLINRLEMMLTTWETYPLQQFLFDTLLEKLQITTARIFSDIYMDKIILKNIQDARAVGIEEMRKSFEPLKLRYKETMKIMQDKLSSNETLIQQK